MNEKLVALLNAEADNDELNGFQFFTDQHVKTQSENLNDLAIRIDDKAGDIAEALRDGTPHGVIAALQRHHDFYSKQFDEAKAALILYLTKKLAANAE